VVNHQVPANLMRTRGLEAKWHKSKRLLGVAAHVTPHKKTQVMSSCQFRPDLRPSAHLAGDGKGKEGRSTKQRGRASWIHGPSRGWQG
jgi:hypothetical protein